ncbi:MULTISPECIES: SusC/RagA family TonB-linked outer membrane protein [Butyricimonas]|uniref:SusC/RagA family TonB-linked outer membrane protein n=1 Tax=Butyricimonas TaxID=574697 RepID=UPI001D084CDE|nr:MULTISPECIES: SusC/RagA family TonB-linked outer membrane protein [Butyricimonas]MCB6974845.1 SusC/RagA family TonB-linked outer membrane protein [Butyricimonas synergistica]MCG4521587.1 SusC/RagA family TonB-linked outer membrane protein [Butyricimonas sp. DFI.6.44]
MEKKSNRTKSGGGIFVRKWMMKMKIVFIFLIFSLMQAAVYAQQSKVSVELKNVTLEKVFQELERQTGYSFLYNHREVETRGNVSVRAENKELKAVLEDLLPRLGLSYSFDDNLVIIKIASRQEPEKKSVRVKGCVYDTKEQSMPGVTVKLLGGSLGTATDVDGRFQLELPREKGTLEFSFIGYKSKQLNFTGKTDTTFQVVLEEDVAALEEVVVTGVFTKAKESYTGAATTITAAELKRVGNRNILSSIRNIDPSFNIVDNPTMGSDPNSLPDITIRGNSSMTSNVKDLQSESQTTQSANMPLFILDGFEITLERMMDLDDNQVESITLLKDASATAMYGTRGANGVVVITTKQPETGKLQLTYKGGLAIEAPDLTSYNLLNAREKLEYEKLAGLYTYNGGPGATQHSLETIYNSRLLAAERGVNTYWLKYPVRTGVGHNHSLRLEGGREEIRYAVGLSYKSVAGAMKGSGRNTLNGNIFLSYKLKNLTFQNDLQVVRNNSRNSPYGIFSLYTKLNSYWKPYDDEGNLLMILDDRNYASDVWVSYSNKVYNPLYNAYLPNIDESKYTQITNNFAIEWRVLPELVVRGKFSVTSKTSRLDKYKPASHTDFLTYTGDDYNRRGSYKMGMGESFKYETDFTLNYNKMFKDIHQIYVGLGYNFAEEKSESFSFVGEGISDDYSDFMGLAASYEKNSSPYGDEGISRRVGGIVNVNYTYDRRYFIDISGKLEGASKFGADNRYAPFWSVGAGWNIHQEHFMRESNGIFNTVRLRVSYGTSGAQNFSPYQAMRTFKYFNTQNYNGNAGSYLLGIGNPDLGWQKTGQLNIGIELSVFDSRLKVTADWYNKLTDDMLADITLPLAGGFGSYKANIGKVQNQGVEVLLNAYLIRDTKRNLFWSVGGTILYNKNEIKKISNSLEFLNDELLESDGSNPSFLFKEGQSMNTIFAVRSLGINPANGKEIYRKADGHTRTYDWEAKDKVACGVTDPKVWGNFNTMLRYKGWTLNAIFSYRCGGQMYNATLANKVENIHPVNNADKRVLYDRWKNPGDKAKYKGVTDLSETRATSRFVADENTLECGSVSLGYEWTSEWLKKNFSISYLSLTGYGEDIFRVSSIKQERGTNYPFARKFSFSLSVRF